MAVGMRLRIENLQTYLSVQASSLVFVICQQSFLRQEAFAKFKQISIILRREHEPRSRRR